MDSQSENFLTGLPDLIFEKVFERAEFYNYNYILSLIEKLPLLRNKIKLSVRRLDITGKHDLHSILNHISIEFPKLKEINLIDVSFDSVNAMKSTLTYYNKIKSLINCKLETNMFDNFMFSVFISTVLMMEERNKTNFVFDITDIQDTQFKLSYKYDNNDISLRFASIASTQILTGINSHMNHLRSLQITTLIVPVNTVTLTLVKMSKVTKLILTEDEEKYGSQSNYINVFDILFTNYDYIIHKLKSNNKDYIPDNIGCPPINVYNLSIRDVTYEGNFEDIVTFDSRLYAYPEIQTFDLPVYEDDLDTIRILLPSVTKFNIIAYNSDNDNDE